MITSIIIIYILGAIFTYGFVKGTVLKEFYMLGWKSRDETMTWLITLLWPVALPIFIIVFSWGHGTQYWTIRFRK